MKITIELTKTQVKGIKAYLKEVSPDVKPHITSEYVKQEIRGIADGGIHFGAMGDYIQQAEKQV